VILHVVSVSGGKDSAATLLLAVRRFGARRVIGIFCDTGNEHDEVHRYLDYLEEALGVRIVRLRANFDAEIAAKRRFVARDVRTRREYDTAPVFDAADKPVPKRDCRGNIVMRTVTRNGERVQEPVQKTRKVGGGRRVRWTNKAKRRALAALVPTGNPFLDLCIWKGHFPSRTAQFCTEELKRNVAVAYQLDLVDAGYTVVSWQGVRRDESVNRRDAKRFELIGPGMYAYRPWVDATAADVFAYCHAHGIQPNPLYRQGQTRVGCMPCINCDKEQIRQTNARFPESLQEKAEWEARVSLASKRGFSTFFNKELHAGNWNDRRVHEANRIENVIRWAHTSRGGRQLDMLAGLIEPTACSSAYGLCDQ